MRLVVDVDRGADLLDLAFVHHHDGVGKRKGFLLVVGDVDEGDAQFPVHLLQFDLHVLAHLEVQGREGLVQQQDLGLVHERPGDGHALLLSAGQGVHVALLVVGHRDHLEDLAHAAVDLVGGHLLQFQAEGDVVIDVQVREERIALEHRVEGTLVRRDAGDVPAVQQDLPFVRRQEARDQAERGGLAAARGAQQGHELAFADVEVDVVEDLLVSERLADVIEVDDVLPCHRLTRA